MGLFGRRKEYHGGDDIDGADSRKGFYWIENQKGENVMWRLPRNIRWNDNVMVREDEYGIFFRDGKAMQVFDRPDRYAMTTQNIAGLQALGKAVVGMTQIGEFYWVQKRDFRSNFGTSEPLSFRDTDFGVVRIRVFGQYAYRVVDPMLFITQFVGTKGLTKSEEIIDWLKDQIVMILNATLGELKLKQNMGVLDMPAYLQQIEQICLTKLTGETEQYGLKITKFAGLNINLPEEVQQAVDKRGAMSALGVNYMQYQSGRAIEDIGRGAAQGGAGEGAGFATLGAGMGAGMGMGHVMGQSMAGGMGAPSQFGGPVQPEQQPGAPAQKCIKCDQPVVQGAKFCPHCGASQAPPTVKCGKCDFDVPQGAKFCPNCGNPMGAKACGKCGAELAPGARFCAGCGESVE
ncbi:membrane protease subunit (stomatin/prohibitin family) [Methanocalculus alkaliphilus]|uniref:SPFH domain-containing protein n=1 Tax=Methanocalculus alkaliphilus TaxID=768730 RepID=UPI0020A12293|nr:SPFH domain-containing protein [Methanocalculus alkaliphilus]MCP1715830.1 membrane protease subunit (stomatin/prohibitin family) [Methanocalculus alkaliphilus]